MSLLLIYFNTFCNFTPYLGDFGFRSFASCPDLPFRKTAHILRTKKQSFATAAFCTQYYPIQALFEGRARTICP